MTTPPPPPPHDSNSDGNQPPAPPFQGDPAQAGHSQSFPDVTQPIPKKTGMAIDFSPMKRLTRAKELMGEQYMLFVGMSFVAIMIAGAIPVVLAGPMICGMFIVFRQRMVGRPAAFDQSLKGFEKFSESLIAYLVSFAVQMIAMIPMYILMMVAMFITGMIAVSAGAEEMSGLFIIPMVLVFTFLMMIVVSMCLAPFVFAFPLIVDRGFGGMDACKESWRMAKPNFWKISKMLMVYYLIAAVSAMCCYVPFFFFAPVAMGAVFTLYQDVYGINQTQGYVPNA